jgi:hypothetical protein
MRLTIKFNSILANVGISIFFVILFVFDSTAQLPEKNYAITVFTGVNTAKTKVMGSYIYPSERNTGTIFYGIDVTKKILPRLYLSGGYYTLYYEYDYKDTQGGFGFYIGQGNTSTRIPLSLKYSLIRRETKYIGLSLYTQIGGVIELVRGRNISSTIDSSIYVKESYNNGLHLLGHIGAGAVLSLGKSLYVTLSTQQTLGFNPLMKREYFSNSNGVDSGIASISGTGTNFSIGIGYKFN